MQKSNPDGAEQYDYNGFNQLTILKQGTTATGYAYNASGIRTAKHTESTDTYFLLDGGDVVAEYTDGEMTAHYVRGINLIRGKFGSNVRYYLFNAHGDVTVLTDGNGTLKKSYDYDAFGNEEKPSSSDTNPFRYCGEYFDKETKTYYLRARYYDPAIGRFTQQDSLLFTTRKLASGYEYADPLSLNLYAYCGNNPVAYIDPTGHQRAAGYYTINGVHGWYDDPDAAEFGLDSDTYKIIDDASKRWFATNNPDERDRLHMIAEAARAHHREHTPYMYGQDTVWNTLISNAQIGMAFQDDLYYSWTYLGYGVDPYLMSYGWFVFMTCSVWDLKRTVEWQVPYEIFGGDNMNESNRKNWTAWIYFEGVLWGADKIGNINLGFVGTAMGFGGPLIMNFATMDKDDGPAVRLGIELADKWLTNNNG